MNDEQRHGNKGGREEGGLVVYTIGHSTQTVDEFVDTLRAYGIGRLVDVRTIPRSSHNPQFNMDKLGKLLRNRRIAYRHMPELGGLRHAQAGSINTGWQNASFRGFADYMQTSDFTAALERLLVLAHEATTAIMCAEAVPWRCHRSLIGDALLVRGVEVHHILSLKSMQVHQLTPMAKVEGHAITYPAPPEGIFQGLPEA
jgi:uncharacterized protein (DUF488 family)